MKYLILFVLFAFSSSTLLPKPKLACYRKDCSAIWYDTYLNTLNCSKSLDVSGLATGSDLDRLIEFTKVLDFKMMDLKKESSESHSVIKNYLKTITADMYYSQKLRKMRTQNLFTVSDTTVINEPLNKLQSTTAKTAFTLDELYKEIQRILNILDRRAEAEEEPTTTAKPVPEKVEDNLGKYILAILIIVSIQLFLVLFPILKALMKGAIY